MTDLFVEVIFSTKTRLFSSPFRITQGSPRYISSCLSLSPAGKVLGPELLRAIVDAEKPYVFLARTTLMTF